MRTHHHLLATYNQLWKTLQTLRIPFHLHPHSRVDLPRPATEKPTALPPLLKTPSLSQTTRFRPLLPFPLIDSSLSPLQTPTILFPTHPHPRPRFLTPILPLLWIIMIPNPAPPPDSHDNRSAPSQSVDSDTEARVSFTGVTVVDHLFLPKHGNPIPSKPRRRKCD